MRYLLLIHGNEDEAEALDEARMGALIESHERLEADLKAEGKFLASDRLRPSAMTTTLVKRDGAATLVDGPFVETKEQLGGYYLIEAADLDEALRWAHRIDCTENGAVEIRPVWEVEDF